MMDRADFVHVLGIALAAAAAGFIYGEQHARAAAEEAERGRTAQALHQLAEADARVLEREKAKRLADYQTFTTYRKEHEDADQKTEAVVADLRADNRRLRIPVRPDRPAAPAAGGSAAGGPGEEGRAELTADAAEFLVRLAGRGDDAIRKHAAVVDAYEHLRAACTATPETTP
jgi:hypothetical protein